MLNLYDRPSLVLNAERLAHESTVDTSVVLVTPLESMASPTGGPLTKILLR